MNIYESGAIILLAGLIHAHFQLSVSMLTLLSGHALGKKTAHARLLRLSGSFLAGALTMIVALLALLILLISNIFPSGTPLLVWGAMCGLMVGVGVAVWVFYYRQRSSGTELWLPRPMARHLSQGVAKTKSSAAAYGFGLLSVVGELIFCLAPMLIAGLFLARLEAPLQLVGIAVYAVVVTLPLAVIIMLVGGGHSLGKIQRWREQSKRFLQFTAGSALIILGGYLYVDMIVVQAAGVR